jgi:hypothetical protein
LTTPAHQLIASRALESIEYGHDTRRRVPVAWAIALVAVLVLGALVWVIDARWRASATADLTLAFDETVTAIEVAERRVQSVMEYTRTTREAADADPAVRASLEALVRETALDADDGISIPRNHLDGVLVLPWHGDLHTAREQAMIWLDLRAAGITSLVATGRATYPPREEIDAARESLRTAWTALRAG